MKLWPLPEGFVPDAPLQALDACGRGDWETAARLTKNADVRDAFAGAAWRTARALVRLAEGDRARALPELRVLSRQRDVALAWIAALHRVEDAIVARRFAHATSALRPFRRRVRDEGWLLWIDATSARVELARRGTLTRAAVDALLGRLQRDFPPVVHAAVHVLRAEQALLQSELPEAVRAQREARPYVRSCAQALLGARHDDTARLLRAPYADVEDWNEPLRTVTREEWAEIEVRDWQVWVDGLHRRVLRRVRSRVEVLPFARLPELWRTLELWLERPQTPVTWERAARAQDLASADAARERGRRLQAELRSIGVTLTVDEAGFTVREPRFVCMRPTAKLPAPALRILGLLACTPHASAADLQTGDPRSTVVHRLQRLRQAGFVRLLGGGRDARYTLV